MRQRGGIFPLSAGLIIDLNLTTISFISLVERYREILSPLRDCVAILKPHECHSEPQAKNLTIPASYKKQILRLAPQDDIATQSLKGEDAARSTSGENYTNLLYCPRFPRYVPLPMPTDQIISDDANLCWPVAGDGESPAHRNKRA